MESIEIDFADDLLPTRAFKLRDYQTEAIAEVQSGWKTYSRLLLDMCTGSGKTSIMNALAAAEWVQGRRTLILENRDALVRQTAKRVTGETGIECDIEMAGDHASPYAPIVVASVQTLSREARLSGFSPEHFQHIVCDEAHHSLSNSFSRVCSYFHYGAASLAPEWIQPDDGAYEVGARILGVTATPELNSTRTLGEFYQHVAYTYQLLQAVHDGWLVPIVAKSMPLEIDLRGLRAGRTPNGSDLKAGDLAERMIPIIEALAKQVCDHAHDRKGIVFLPSVECARLFSEAVNRRGFNGIFVSGKCLDVDEKTEAYRRGGPGTILSNCALYVEGADFPDTSLVCCARATESVSYFKQMVGRGTRVLPGIVDGLPTPEVRRAAIAASPKPDLLLLDPLWRHEKMNLCDAYNLFTDKPEVKERMKKDGPPNEESAREAERDFIKALEKEAKKHARKKSRMIDPLEWSLVLNDEKLASYKPERSSDFRPLTPGQISFFQKHQIDHTKVSCFGLANKIIGIVMARFAAKRATPHQLDFMHRLGIPDDAAMKMSQREAGAAIDARLKAKRG